MERAIDMLSVREADPLADWLEAHPGTRVICRERVSSYAKSARDGAPGPRNRSLTTGTYGTTSPSTAKAVA